MRQGATLKFRFLDLPVVWRFGVYFSCYGLSYNNTCLKTKHLNSTGLHSCTSTYQIILWRKIFKPP